MFLPRRRITSLTILTFILLTFYYLNPFRRLSSPGLDFTPSAHTKQKPADQRLSPPENEKTVISEPTGDESDRFNLSTSETDTSEDVDPSIESSKVPTPAVEADPSSTGPKGGKPTSDLLLDTRPPPTNLTAPTTPIAPSHIKTQKGQYVFGDRKFTEKFPVEKLKKPSEGKAKRLPSLQWAGQPEKPDARRQRIERLHAVRESFAHSWAGYKTHAWKKDEVKPVSGGSETSFGGWAASLVDALDTLWIMGMKGEFDEAVKAVKDIDFTTTEEENLNVFETTIRYLGGFLAAYDLSYGKGKYDVLLEKAVELGDFMYCAFDTPNRMPVTRWEWGRAMEGEDQVASAGAIVAEVGSLSLEFTRLSQLTGDPKYYDAVTRIMEEFQKSQMSTKIPGLWPLMVSAKTLSFNGDGFTLGGMADSLFEYLPKQHMLLGGHETMYEEMYKHVITASMNHMFFRPMLPDNADVLFPGSATASDTGSVHSRPDGQHLSCYAGGMVGIGSKLFDNPDQLSTARKLVDGCIWAYEHSPNGIMPESFTMIPCKKNSECTWDEEKWQKEVLLAQRFKGMDEKEDLSQMTTDEEKVQHVMKAQRLRAGFADINDRRYILRPEAIESVFIHYRLTGDADLPDKAWRMFEAIENVTRTEIANSAVQDVTADEPVKDDRMESFWMAETLKYFYLIFAEPDVVSLDDYVL